MGKFFRFCLFFRPDSYSPQDFLILVVNILLFLLHFLSIFWLQYWF